MRIEKNNGMINEFSPEEQNSVIELLALIAWKIELQEKQHNPKALKLAFNTTVATAKNFAVKPYETGLCEDLQTFLHQIPGNLQLIDEFNRTRSIKEKLRDVIRLFLTHKESNEVRVFCNFLYRYAARLSEVSGESFAGMGKRLDASEAEILMEIRDELPR